MKTAPKFILHRLMVETVVDISFSFRCYRRRLGYRERRLSTRVDVTNRSSGQDLQIFHPLSYPPMLHRPT